MLSTVTPPVARRIAVVTVGRSDYGLLRPLLRRLSACPDVHLDLIVAAAHWVGRYGDTAQEIAADGFTPAARVDCTLAADTPASIARSMGLATLGFAQAYEQLSPDLLVVLGDRYEAHAAVTAATPMLIPVAHIAGGAVTRGAIDDALRHSMSKLSHLHFPETAAQGERLARLGEETWRVTVAGSLSIDNVLAVSRMDMGAFNTRFGVDLDAPPLLVTYHPATRRFEDAAERADALLEALDDQPQPTLFTYPNSDTAGSQIIKRIDAFVQARPGRSWVVPHLGTEGYFSAMGFAAAMVGNSSSGIIEAASFGLPVVDIGRRQEGRDAPANVIRCGEDTAAIRAAIKQAVSPAFRTVAAAVRNPYGDGDAANRIAEVVTQVPLDERLIVKATF